MSNNLEKLTSSQDYNVESKNSAAEQLDKLALEKSLENNQENSTELVQEAKNEAIKAAISIEKKDQTEKMQYKSSSSRRGPINKKQLDESYKKTLNQIQKELPANEKVFSKIIHSKALEKTSETLGSTIARPNSILAGAFCAFILTLILYVVAKTLGYRLSGSETIIAFVIGWLIGIIFDYLKIIITGKK